MLRDDTYTLDRVLDALAMLDALGLVFEHRVKRVRTKRDLEREHFERIGYHG